MTILVVGGTGLVGSHVLKNLSAQGVTVHALTREPDKVRLPDGIVPIKGDMLDVASMRAALAQASTLFLLNAVAPQELSEAMLTLNLAREVGVRQVVYFSVFNSERFTNVPHLVAKYTIERMIEQLAIPATILRANCFMQNDVMFKDPLLGHGVYPFPIGAIGVSMVDVRDIAEVATIAILRRKRSADPLPHEIINLVGPDVLTGVGNAAIWSNILEKPVKYSGDDLVSYEQQAGLHAPNWMAMDLRLMLGHFQQDGMVAAPGDVEVLTELLGRPLRSYVEFATETLAQWKA